MTSEEHEALLRTVETWPDYLAPLPTWVHEWAAEEHATEPQSNPADSVE